MSIKPAEKENAHSAATRRGWRQVHHSPLFWVGVLLSLAAISIYVFSEDLSWRPHSRHATHTAPAAPSGGML